jgi:hypothetical protein
MKKVTTGKIVFVLALLVLLLQGCATSNKGMPHYALTQLREAILNHDADSALRYVDVDRVVDNIIERKLAQQEARTDGQAAGIEAGRRIMPLILPALRQFVRDQLRIAITSSDESGYFSTIRKASVWYLNIVIDGDRAVVTPRGSNKAAFTMAKNSEGFWKIIEIMPDRPGPAEQSDPGPEGGVQLKQ